MNKTTKNIIIPALILFVFVSIFSFSFVSADTANTGPSGDTGANIATPTLTSTKADIVPLKNPLSSKFNTVGGLINSLMEIFSYVAIIVAVLALIWVGFQFIMAQGNTEKIGELKTWFYYIVIGTAIILASRLIVSVIINTLEASGAVSQDVIQKVREPLNNQ